MAHFKVEHLSIAFGGIKAVNDVSFEVEHNKIFSIIGPNTTLNYAGALAPAE